jgi:hypothetical protein
VKRRGKARWHIRSFFHLTLTEKRQGNKEEETLKKERKA